MPYELQKKTIEVCDETLVVSQASNLMDVRRARLIRDATEHPAEGDEDNYFRYVRTLLYPSLVACTIGNIPTFEQFLDEVPTDDSDRWVEDARELNPRWFAFLTEREEGEEVVEEKKEQ